MDNTLFLPKLKTAIEGMSYIVVTVTPFLLVLYSQHLINNNLRLKVTRAFAAEYANDLSIIDSKLKHTNVVILKTSSDFRNFFGENMGGVCSSLKEHFNMKFMNPAATKDSNCDTGLFIVRKP